LLAGVVVQFDNPVVPSGVLVEIKSQLIIIIFIFSLALLLALRKAYHFFIKKSRPIVIHNPNFIFFHKNCRFFFRI
jgi:hypothetical protein